MMTIFTFLDIAAIASSLVAAMLWYQAGARTVRRISRSETLDAADLNRMVVSMNRSAILNRRAALASAASATCFALRFAASFAAGV
ncbi:hypothetical protein [Roseovarius sp. D0-M9]|uniref:hypothetical protein n=1 Tax=Roseovarius sp. D0-M9 TaxID=3127117 RepID=UPI0030101C81